MCCCADASLRCNEFDYWFDGLPSSESCCLKFIVMLPDVSIESCRPKFHNAKKNSKNANSLEELVSGTSQSEMWNCETQVVRFAVVWYHGDSNPKRKHKNEKTSSISYSMVLTVVVLYVEALWFERRATSQNEVAVFNLPSLYMVNWIKSNYNMWPAEETRNNWTSRDNLCRVWS